jgi:hypothetical protein
LFQARLSFEGLRWKTTTRLSVSSDLHKFEVVERFFGLNQWTTVFEVSLQLKEPIARGEERIVASLPDSIGPRWSAEAFDEVREEPYLEYLRALASAKASSRILGWTSGADDSPLPDTAIRVVGADREYKTRSNERGIFELTGVRPGKYRVMAARPHFETIESQEVEVVPGGCAVASFLFAFEGKIGGTVRDREGRPLPGLRIWLKSIRRKRSNRLNPGKLTLKEGTSLATSKLAATVLASILFRRHETNHILYCMHQVFQKRRKVLHTGSLKTFPVQKRIFGYRTRS